MRYFQPETFEELFRIMNSEEDSRFIAGGTDLVILLEETGNRPDTLIDITGIQEISGIKEDNSGITIGAATTISEISTSSNLPCCLRKGASSIGSPQIRNVATIGGNICNASPCGDTLAPLLSLNAEFILKSLSGWRSVSAEDFFLGPKKSVLKKNEILSEIRIKKEYLSGRSGFRMIGQRNGQVISQVNLAVWLRRAEQSNIIDEIRIAAGSVAPTPIRITKAEELLCDSNPDAELILEAGQIVQASIKPIDDVRSSAEYRHNVISGFFQDIMTQVLKQKELETC